MKTLLLLITLVSLSAFAGDRDCKVDVIFPYGTEEINDKEVLSTFDGPLESLTTNYINEEINKALGALDIGVSGRGERADFKIVVGFSGMLNKKGSLLTESYLQVRNYERSVESRAKATLIDGLKSREKIAKKLFDKALKDLVPLLDSCK